MSSLCPHGFSPGWDRLQQPLEPECTISGDRKRMAGWINLHLNFKSHSYVMAVNFKETLLERETAECSQKSCGVRLLDVQIKVKLGLLPFKVKQVG